MNGDHCPCIAASHAHEPGHCDEPAPATGFGVCPTCQYSSNRPATNADVRGEVRAAILSWPVKKRLLDDYS